MSERPSLSSASRFLDKARAFIRNPLGIIGLFVALIYGLASFVAIFGDHLTDDQMWVLLWLIFVFPFAVLAAFYRLVTEHHHKLYAPADWRDERNLFGMQGEEVREALLSREAVQLAERVPEGERGADLGNGPKRSTAELVREAEPRALEVIRDRFPGQEFIRAAFLHDPRNDGIVPVDALAIHRSDRTATAIEVKLLLRFDDIYSTIRDVVRQFKKAADAVVELDSYRLRFLIVLVAVGVERNRLEQVQSLAEHEANREFWREDVEVVVLDFDELSEGNLDRHRQ